MTMHINLSPEMEGFIKHKVSSGFYGNATEVIRDRYHQTGSGAHFDPQVVEAFTAIQDEFQRIAWIWVD